MDKPTESKEKDNHLNQLLVEIYKNLLDEKEKEALELRDDLELESKLLDKLNSIVKLNDEMINDLKLDMVKNLQAIKGDLKEEMNTGENDRDDGE